MAKEHTEEKTTKQLAAENKALREELTRKNQEYIYQFDKLMESEYSYREKRDPVQAENKILKTMVENQGAGRTARQLFGTPTELAKSMQDRPTEEELAMPPFWQIWLDNSLFIGALFCALAGIIFMFSTGENAHGDVRMYGIGCTLVNFVFGGLAMTVLQVFQPDQDAPKGKKGWGRYILASIVMLLVWLAAVSLAMVYLPEALNRILPSLAYLLIAAAAYFLRREFRKYFHIEERLAYNEALAKEDRKQEEQ